MKMRIVCLFFLLGLLQASGCPFSAEAAQEYSPVTQAGRDTIQTLLDQARDVKREQGEKAAISFFKKRVTQNHTPVLLQVLYEAIRNASDQEVPFLIRLGRMYVPQEYTTKQRTVPGTFIVVAGIRNSVGKVLTFFVQDNGVIKSKSEKSLSFEPEALAIDPMGKWIAVGSAIVGAESSITILRQNNDGTLTPVHTVAVRGGPVIALSYDPPGNWLVAASLAGLSLYAQEKNGSLQKMDSDIAGLGGPSLNYNSAGDVIVSTSNLRSGVKVTAQTRGQLQEQGELRSHSLQTLFTDVCFASDGTLFVAEFKMSSNKTMLKQYRMDISTGLFELVDSFPIQAYVTSLAPHPHFNMLAVAIGPTILLLEWDRTAHLRIKEEYSSGELGEGEFIVRYDESGNWLGVLNVNRGNFVLFKQDGAVLNQVDTYAFNLRHMKFGFFYPRALTKAFVQKQVERATSKRLPTQVEAYIETFVTGE